MTPMRFWYQWLENPLKKNLGENLKQFCPTEMAVNISAMDGPIYLKSSGIIAEVQGYLTVSNLKMCHIPFKEI